jgi:hypothetical protein
MDVSQPTRTQLVSSREQLLSSIDNAAYRPISDDDVLAARQRAREAAERLDTILRQGSEENREAWHRFLRWEQLQGQLAPQQPIDTAVLGQILSQMYNGDPGLELPEFVALRDALMTLRRLVAAQSDPEIESRVAEQLRQIRTEMPDLAETNVDDLVQLATRLEWLEQLDQAPELVQQIRNTYRAPNLLVSASEQTVSAGFSEPVSELTSINEMILGTHIRGTAHLSGAVRASLVPDSDSALIQLTLSGTTYSDTIGRQKPVTIYSRAVTQVLAQKLLVLDEVGVRAQPACAQCTTDSQICSIRPDGHFAEHLVQKIAWKKARQQQPQVERISSLRAADRIEAQMDQQVLQRIADSNTQLRQEVRKPLERRNLYPNRLHFWTTAHRLRMAAVQAARTQLASATAPPAMPEHDLTMQLHESLVLNSAANGLGGITITDERAQKLVEEATGSVPEGLQIKQDEDPWSITFDIAQPIRVEFQDDLVTIAIRGRRFVRGEQTVRQITQIAARYAVEIHNGRIRLVRQGEIDVTYPEKAADERLSLTELRNKTFLINKFDGLFKPELDAEGAKLPENWSRLKEMQLVYANSSQGWLSLGWERTAP